MQSYADAATVQKAEQPPCANHTPVKVCVPVQSYQQEVLLTVCS